MKKVRTPIVAGIALGMMLLVGAGFAANDDWQAGLEQIGIMGKFIDVMQNYVDFSKDYLELLDDEAGAAFLVAERVTELYEQKGSKVESIPELRKIASKYTSNTALQKAIHLKVAEIYKEAGQHDKALKELQAAM